MSQMNIVYIQLKMVYCIRIAQPIYNASVNGQNIFSVLFICPIRMQCNPR